MYENMTVLTNREYSELIIKANKYDQLRDKAVRSRIVTDAEAVIFELTENELEAIAERRRKEYETL